MLSVVVNFYNNRREAQNTLYSLTRQYQRGIDGLDYEVIAIDHGSSEPLAESTVRACGPEFHYRYVETDSVSPVVSMNAACREARGDYLLVMIDGAHIVSPDVLRLACSAFQLIRSPFVATISLHLGPKRQNMSILEGYNEEVEDQLLGQSGWKENGYKLYEIAGELADDSGGWFGALMESGCFGLRKDAYLRLGGYDERFQTRGGGLTNLDFFQRALGLSELSYVMLLGEATFHQVHGGVATNATPEEHPWEEFHAEYQSIRQQDFYRVLRRPLYLGTLPAAALELARRSAAEGLKFWQRIEARTDQES